jgi:hypothetical protein
MSVLGAGVGAFSQGYESGSPVSGGLGGALGGIGAAGSIGSFLGVGALAATGIGAVAGAALGILGGVLGGKKQREAEHQAKADEWAKMAPEWNAYQQEMKTGTGDPRGIRQMAQGLDDQLVKFVASGSDAWKKGSNNSSELYAQVSQDRIEYIQRTVQLFKDQFETAVDSLNRGEGLKSKFDEIRETVRATGEELVTFLDDTSLALGGSSIAYGDAQKASQNQLLSIFEGAQPLSEVASAMEQMKAAAAVLPPYLVQLGMSAEDAGIAVDEKLTGGIRRLGESVTQGLQDEIDALDGKGYLADFRALMAQHESIMADTVLTNVDTSLVGTFFAKQAQSMVDGAELSGDAFDELIKAFPSLTDVVHEFAGSLDEIAAQIKSYDDRVFATSNDNSRMAGRLAAFDRAAAQERLDTADAAASVIEAREKALGAERLRIILDFGRQAAQSLLGYSDRYFAATTDTSSLSGALGNFERGANRDRVTEMMAGAGNLPYLNATLAAEKVSLIKGLLTSAYETERNEIEQTISTLQSLSDQWRDLRLSLKFDDNLSTLAPKDQFLEAQKQFRDISAKAAAGDEDAQQKLAGISQSYLEEAKSYYASSEAYYAAFNEVQSVLENAESLASQQLAAQKAQLDATKSQLGELQSINGNTFDIVGGLAALAEAMTAASKAAAAAGITPVSSGGTPIDPALAYLQNNPDVLAAIASGETFGNVGMTAAQLAAYHYQQFGQNEGRGYAVGGLVAGPGTGTSDSIRARLSAGEFVMPAAMVTPRTLPSLEAMRLGRSPGNDNGDMVAELGKLRAEVSRLGSIIAASDEATREEIRVGNRSAGTSARAAERRSAA